MHIQVLGLKKEDSGEAIASSMLELAKVKVPVIAIVIGEGSSGGALALGLGNKVLMLENAIYSILSPEGYASILWKDSSRVKEAADKIIKEPKEINDEAFGKVVKSLKQEIKATIAEMKDMEPEEIVEQRYQKFRNMGEYITLN